MYSYSYENVRRVVYESGATFIPICKKCGQFVKKDETIQINRLGELRDVPNATCKKHGRVQMIFEGFF